jgi:hypothetical protein
VLEATVRRQDYSVSSTDLTERNVMPGISPLIARIFDDPHSNHRRKREQRARLESRGRVPRAKRS